MTDEYCQAEEPKYGFICDREKHEDNKHQVSSYCTDVDCCPDQIFYAWES